MAWPTLACLARCGTKNYIFLAPNISIIRISTYISILSMLQVTPYSREGLMWGFTVSFLKDGVSATDIRVAFDDEVTLKHEWVGRGVGKQHNRS